MCDRGVVWRGKSIVERMRHTYYSFVPRADGSRCDGLDVSGVILVCDFFQLQFYPALKEDAVQEIMASGYRGWVSSIAAE